jgi:hypothetical protein
MLYYSITNTTTEMARRKPKKNEKIQCINCNTTKMLIRRFYQIVCTPCLILHKVNKCIQCKIIINDKNKGDINNKVCKGCLSQKNIFIPRKDVLKYKYIDAKHLSDIKSFIRELPCDDGTIKTCKYYFIRTIDQLSSKLTALNKPAYTETDSENDRFDEEQLELDCLRRTIIVNRFFARHGIASKETDEPHQNCDRIVNDYIRYMNDYSEEDIENHIEGIIADIREEEAEEKREKQLNKAFDRNNLSRERASENIEDYISGDFDELFKNNIHSFKDLMQHEIYLDNERLKRMKYINTLFEERHDIPANKPYWSHQLCCNFLDTYINEGDKDISTTTLKHYVDKASKKYRQQEKRSDKLNCAFKKRNLVVRDDSSLCDAYIEGGLSAASDRISTIKCIEDIVDISEEMHFLFTHTDYDQLVQFQRDREKPNIPEQGVSGWTHPDEYSDGWNAVHDFNEHDMQHIRESNKPIAIRKFLVNGGSKKLVPRHLFKKYADEL